MKYHKYQNYKKAFRSISHWTLLDFFENYYSYSDTPIHTYTRKIDNRDNLKTCIKVSEVYGHLKGIIHC
jgi:hypothetical protein